MRSYRPFHFNEPFFQDGGYKTSEVIKFFEKKPKKQVKEFIRINIVIILNSYNEKVIFIVFISKM